jgi:hypothetical protein
MQFPFNFTLQECFHLLVIDAAAERTVVLATAGVVDSGGGGAGQNHTPRLNRHQ